MALNLKDDQKNKDKNTSTKIKNVAPVISSLLSVNNLNFTEKEIVYNLTINTHETTKFSRVFEFETFQKIQKRENNATGSTITETISFIDVKIFKKVDTKTR